MRGDTLNRELEAALRSELDAEVRFDEITRVLYSTDASNYQIEPVGVVIPKTVDDLVGVVQIAGRYNVAILPRGGGTSLAGQAVGDALIIDTSKYLNKIKSVDVESKTVWAEPGIYLQQLNMSLAEYGLMFGPDPSTARIATIGGVVGNNATGAHSILYGMAGDHVMSCKLVSGHGSLCELDVNTKGQFYSNIANLKKKHEQLIKKGFPKHWRRASGYSLNYLLDKNINPAKLIAGSEGTLGIVSEFTLNLVPRPKRTGLVILQFEEIIEAMNAVPVIIEQEPSAIELIDKMLIELTRAHPGFASLLTFIKGTPQAVLVVEFYGNTWKEVEKKCRDLKVHLSGKRIDCDIRYAFSDEDQSRVWQLRRAGLGLLMSRRDDYKPIPCIEDVSVPAGELSNYVGDITEVMSGLGAEAAFYGHASAGCLHIRPLVNLKTASGVEIMRELTEQALGLAIKYGGVLSGEHGDGLQRSYLNEKLFGSEIYGVMKELKSIFDPENMFNPGKVVDAPADFKNLRYGNDYKTEAIKTRLDWSNDDSFAGAVEMCSGQGVCRKLDEGIMCPSYIATRDERDSTRARANALRSVLSGKLPIARLASKEMHDVFDLCISCKACKTECPSGVDGAKMKTEFLASCNNVHGISVRDRMLSSVHEISRASSKISPFANLFLNNVITKRLLSKFGIHEQRSLPNLSKETFADWFSNRHMPNNSGKDKQVIYFHDTWTSYYKPEVGKAAVKLLEAAGFSVILASHRECCGRPMLSKGIVEPARTAAKKNASLLGPHLKAGILVVGTEPSCVLTFRDEYPDLLPEDEDVKLLSGNSFLLEEFLHDKAELELSAISWKQQGPAVLFHGHCHARALVGNTSSINLLELAGCKVTDTNAGCCGMAGSFGYEKEHYEISKTIGEDRLFPIIKDSQSDAIIAVSGYSCAQQIEHFTGRKTKHIAEVLADQINS
ncbi:MAG: FAD-binding protein [Candidatus Dadabacteria bacterium]|nr:FAD-binding protein [Candidatus Dadabacteria bacterium]NIS10280.1 FAD-binding protein [Candidatus Dadabacteria bacterium]NIY23206.1 FAD-binding protein [Candidatus Dadabacteria bacterium]